MRHKWLWALIAVLIPTISPAYSANPELAHAASPYLRQHADDPVNWHTWSPEALEQARREGKVVFLSIGYASCHFCHRMARETFADPEVAKVLDATFISILIDREERPDLDAWFGRVMIATGGQAGWPMTMFLTPDLVPLFGANFMPPHGDAGGPGFLDVATALAADWRNDHDALIHNIDALRPQLGMLAEDGAGTAIAGDPRETLTTTRAAGLDPLYGGFGTDAKFPQPAALILLLHQAVRLENSALLNQVTKTLDYMAAGGIRDQLGGAFHRYASDRLWLAPHFEIDLSDNALLARLYLEAFQATGRATYAAIARGILDDLSTRLRRSDGAFASGLSAECGDIEGACYTWSAESIRAVLPNSQPFLDAYLPPGGGRRVLRLTPQSLDTALPGFAQDRDRLRAARPLPPRDDKVLTSGNALTASAFALGARVFSDADDRKVAEEIIQQIDTPTLRHRRDGAEVFLDDYAFLIQAILDLAEGGADTARLDHAQALAKTMIARFQDAPGRPLRFTPRGDHSPTPPMVLLQEDGQPTGNAVALADLERLALLRGETDSAVGALANTLAGAAAQAPGLAAAWDYRMGAREIVIVGPPNDPNRAALLAMVNHRLLSGTVLTVLDPKAPENGPWAMLNPRPMEEDKATAYVCHKGICNVPVTSEEDLKAVLAKP